MRTLRLWSVGALVWVGVWGAAVATPDPAAVAIDFSTAGYASGAGLPPAVPTRVRLAPAGRGNDDTERLQRALDYVGALPLGPDGVRGAVELTPGTFHVAGQLRLNAGGVVLRGSVQPGAETVVIGEGETRDALIRIGTTPTLWDGTGAQAVAALHVPQGAQALTVPSVDGFAPGDTVVVTRPSTAAWIARVGMDQFAGAFADLRTRWAAGSRDLVWERTVTAVEPGMRRLVLDAPLTSALELEMGGGWVARASGPAAPRVIGIEDLVLVSAVAADLSRDEEHRWIAVQLDHVTDAWVARVTARRFVSSAVRVGERARRVTVIDCRSEAPVSEVGGYRREAFAVFGQQVLVARCEADEAWNAFAVGHATAGPVVFFDCRATRAVGPAGAVESWSAGVLYENVRIEGAALMLTRDDARTQGAGWTAANALAWNCAATAVVVEGVSDAPNQRVDSAESLLAWQRQRRGFLGELPRWTRMEAEERAVVTEAGVLPAAVRESPAVAAAAAPVRIEGGRFVTGDRVIWGGAFNAAWWRGQIPAATAARAGVSVTRFVPGRDGYGQTERLAELADRMVANGTPFYHAVTGLWYDRRRDDHTTVARTDAQVWAPFYELPWARSGEGRAWDGLSRYDLTRFNPWYFTRLRDFAQAAGERGLVVTVHLYNTHNLLETRAHWVDFPWRPANNINDTGLPDPDPIDPGDEIHIANRFFDVSHAGRRALHRAFIRHHLETLGRQASVVFSLAFQYAGPPAFQTFFLDTVGEWERETGRTVKVALVTSRELTEAVLADPARAALVDVIDLRYWQRLTDGTWWAPVSGIDRAFREQNQQRFGKGFDTPPDTTALHVYQHVRDYRARFPDKAVVAWHGGQGSLPVLMAGGAQALLKNPSSAQTLPVPEGGPLDDFIRTEWARALLTQTPRDGAWVEPDTTWALASADGATWLISSLAGESIRATADLAAGDFVGGWLNPKTGERRAVAAVRLEPGVVLTKPTAEVWVLWLRRLAG